MNKLFIPALMNDLKAERENLDKESSTRSVYIVCWVNGKREEIVIVASMKFEGCDMRLNFPCS